MTDSVRGRLVLKAVPGGDRDNKIIAYLCGLTRQSDPDKVASFIKKAPVVLAKSISEKKGKSILMNSK